MNKQRNKKNTVADSNSHGPIRRQRLIHCAKWTDNYCDHCDVMRQQLEIPLLAHLTLLLLKNAVKHRGKASVSTR